MNDTAIRVLLIEDNPGDPRLTREALAGASGSQFRLECADRLSTGLQQLAGQQIDVALLDLGLPDSQGLETLERAHQRAPGVPIAVLTGTDDEDVGLVAVQAGAQDYLVKGQFDGNSLARSLRYAIERKRLEEQLWEQVRRDPLTGALNHAAIVGGMRSLVSGDGEGAPCAVAMVDVDDLKATNDTYGHQVGDAEFLMAVATQVTAIARTAGLVEELQSASARLVQAHTETVMLLAAAAEAHDHTTGLHLQNVRAITEALARELGYSEGDARDAGLAGVLHDIGKVRVPDTILSSTGRLAEEEWELMKHHTTWGEQFLRGRPGFELAATIARSHHERWDGSAGDEHTPNRSRCGAGWG